MKAKKLNPNKQQLKQQVVKIKAITNTFIYLNLLSQLRVY